MPGSEWLGGVLGWTQEEVGEYAGVPRMTAKDRLDGFSQMRKSVRDKFPRMTPQEIAEDVGVAVGAVNETKALSSDLDALPNLKKLADGRTGETAYQNHEKQHGQQR